jgi:hypothetical protein
MDATDRQRIDEAALSLIIEDIDLALERFDDDEFLAKGDALTDREPARFTSSGKKGWKDVVDALPTMPDVTSLKEWVRTRMFKPFFLRYLLEGTIPAASLNKRAGSLTTIVELIEKAGNSGDDRYTTPFPNTSAWTIDDHTARCLNQLLQTNCGSSEGLFFMQATSRDEMEHILWKILQLAKADCAPSRLPKQGRALLALTTLEWDQVQAAAQAAAQQTTQETSSTPTDTAIDAPDPENDPEMQGNLPEGNQDDQLKHTSATGIDLRDGTDAREAGPAERKRGSWKETEVLPLSRRHLKMQSPTFDVEEPFWQFEMITTLLRATKGVAAAQDATPIKHMAPKIEKDAVIEGGHKSKILTPFATMVQTVTMQSAYRRAQELDTWHPDPRQLESEEGNTTPLIAPTKESLYLAMEHSKRLDNTDFQRENHAEACQALGITNPERPKIQGMNPSAILKPWQPVAIHAITQFMKNPLLKGCILADGVGLGKT